MVRSDSASDADLAERVRAGEVAAFRAVYARYADRVFRFLARLAGDRAVAEDLLQETWLAFARSAGRLEPTGDLAPLLFTIARNKFRNWRRWAVLDLGRLTLLHRGASDAHASAGGSEGDARESLAIVERALSELPTASREILLLVAMEGLEPSQAAGVLGVSPEAARQRLARARAQLAERVETIEARGLRARALRKDRAHES